MQVIKCRYMSLNATIADKSLRNYAPWAALLGLVQNASLRILFERFRDLSLKAGAKTAVETLQETNAVHAMEEAAVAVINPLHPSHYLIF